MAHIRSKTLVTILLVVAGFAITYVSALAQTGVAGAPAPAAAQGPGRGGRGGGLPGASAGQMQAVADMNAALAEFSAALSAARTELAMATFAESGNAARIAAAVEAVREAELALATRRAEEFARLQAGPNRLNADQVTALVAAGGNPGAGGRGGRRGGAAPTGASVAPVPGATTPPAGRGRGN